MGPDSELPYEKIVHELPREKLIPGFVSAISFEEASERELQYQRSMKMMLMRPSVDNNILPVSPNALKPNPVGMKRKATSPSHPQKALQAIQDQKLLHGQTPGRQAPPCQLQSHQSSPQQSLLWCNLCEIPCMNSFCLEQHRQGKRHKAKMEEVLDSKNRDSDKMQELWCQQCNIWCIDEMSLTQHQIGKKHAARLLELEASEPIPIGIERNAALEPIPVVIERNAASEPIPVVIERNAASPSHPQEALQAIHDQMQPLRQIPDRQAPLCLQLSNQSSLQQSHLWCSLCEVPCMNSHCLEQHRQGKKHKAKMEEVLDSKNSDSDKKQELWCQQCNIWCIDKMSLAQHQIGKKHAARLLELRVPKPNLVRTQQLDIQCPSAEKTAVLWCNLCNVPCMTELNLEQHLHGKQHKAKMEEVGDSENSGTSKKPKQVFWCLECNIWCIDEMALAQHQRGKKHALRQLELKGSLSSPDPRP